MTTTPKIEIRGLKKAFGPKVVLNGVDLDIGAFDRTIFLERVEIDRELIATRNSNQLEVG